jgi:hypothetical protein
MAIDLAETLELPHLPLPDLTRNEGFAGPENRFAAVADASRRRTLQTEPAWAHGRWW